MRPAIGGDVHLLLQIRQFYLSRLLLRDGDFNSWIRLRVTGTVIYMNTYA